MAWSFWDDICPIVAVCIGFGAAVGLAVWAGSYPPTIMGKRSSWDDLGDGAADLDDNDDGKR